MVLRPPGSAHISLTQQQTDTAWQDWLSKLPSKYKVSYGTGYAPATTATSTLPTTTG